MVKEIIIKLNKLSENYFKGTLTYNDSDMSISIPKSDVEKAIKNSGIKASDDSYLTITIIDDEIIAYIKHDVVTDVIAYTKEEKDNDGIGE